MLKTHEKNKIVYVLILLVVILVVYPIADGERLSLLLTYQLLYQFLIIAGIFIARRSVWEFRTLIALGVLWFFAGGAYAFASDLWTVQLVTYVVLGACLIMVARILTAFIFTSKVVDRNVIYAAVAVYLLIGAIFVTVYGVVDSLSVHVNGHSAFADAQASPDAVFPWQSLVYYSLATLTTLGYGDVLPVTMWARSLASAQAVIGVLYTTILISRLVGVYASQESEGVLEEMETLRKGQG